MVGYLKKREKMSVFWVVISKKSEIFYNVNNKFNISSK